ncbi:MAG: DCC1-like thiol-disulfide oxidoreductase family protein [Janthinobacterium lividum]
MRTVPVEQTRPGLLGRLFGSIARVYATPVDGTGLAVFRIVFCLVLLAEILHIFYFKALIFDPIPFVEASEVNYTLPLVLWMGTVLLLIFGWFTRAAAVANYGFALLFFSSMQTYSYMITPVYIGMSFLFLFLPIERCLSLDRLRLKLKYSTPDFHYTPARTVSQLAYYVPIITGIAFVYLDSTLYKLVSPMWLQGLGMWKTMSTPFETQLNGSAVLNQELVVKFLGYLTLVFEFFFLFLFPFRKYRVALLLIGIGLHVGILVFFTFPLFSVGFGSLYLLLVPSSWWQAGVARARPPLLSFYYDAEHLLGVRTRLVLEHFDGRQRIRFLPVQQAQDLAPAALLAGAYSIDHRGQQYQGLDTYIQALQAIRWLKPLAWLLRLPGIYHLARAAYGWVARHRPTARAAAYATLPLPTPDEEVEVLRNVSLRDVKVAAVALGLTGLVLLQCLASYNTPLLQLLRRKSGWDATLPGRGLARVAAVAAQPGRNFFGITNHPIALDEHFAGYTRLVAVTYAGADGQEHFLPITRPNGQPGAYLYGVVWLHWTYQVVSRHIEQPRLENGIRNFTAFWAQKHHVDLTNCRFKIKVKKIAEATSWQPNFLNQQLAAGWVEAGEVTWKNRQFTAHLADINAL